MKKYIFLGLFAFLCCFIIIGCNEKECPECEKCETIVVETKTKEETKQETKQETSKETCEEVECPTCEECPEAKKGNLYVHYVLNNGNRDILEKVEDIYNYELLKVSYEGHRFLGWHFDEELTEILVSSDLYLPDGEEDVIVYAYAKWKSLNCVVTFMDGDNLIKLENVSYGSSATAPTPPEKKYYKFVGWSCDFDVITGDLCVEAIYEQNLKTIIVVLGNWMNNDGTMSATLIKRLGLALEAIDKFDPMYVVVTGGMANSQAGIAEATAMYNYLVTKGVSKDLLIKEDQSMSTEQNAIYTFKLIEDIDFENLIIVSTMEHFYTYKAIQYFNDAAMKNSKIKAKNIKIMAYTNIQ